MKQLTDHPCLLKRRWIFHEPDPAVVASIVAAHGVTDLVARVMANRGITVEDGGKYLSPTLSTMYDPDHLHEMPIAAARFADAIESGEHTVCWGDFDADGTCSTSILVRFCRMLGVSLSTYIPDRVAEGYGLNEVGLRDLKSKGCSLLITVDLGVTAVKEAKICRELDIDLIITDHHALNDDGSLPEAVAVVNPLIPGSYPFRYLAGAGVAFALVVATRKELRKRGFFRNRQEPNISELLPLVAVATIADLVELKSENRVFVTHGLRKVYSIPGLKALAQVAGLDLRTPPSAGHVAFRIAPRINASGRMSSAATALELLTTDSSARAEELAEILNQFNEERQAEEQRVVKDALAILEAKPDLLRRKTIVLAGKFMEGVVGIAAGRIADIYHRPTILISERDDGTGKGSCRSISAFHMREGLDRCSDHLCRYGGHPMAAGLSLELAALEPFMEAFEKAAAGLTDDDLRPVTRIDAELAGEHIHLGTLSELERLEPFGMGNTGPVFCVKGATVTNVTTIKQKHLKMNVVVDGMVVPAVGWGMFNRQGEVANVMDIAFALDINNWKGESTIQLVLKDFRQAGT